MKWPSLVTKNGKMLARIDSGFEFVKLFKATQIICDTFFGNYPTRPIPQVTVRFN